MTRERRPGVSTYLETFILIAVAAGGAAAVFSAAGGYISSAGGASIAVSGLEVRQGPYLAVERVSLTNTGSLRVASFTVTTGDSSAAQYCATLVDESSGSPVAFSAPPAACGSGTSANPASVTITPSRPISQGDSVAITLLVSSADQFQPGVDYNVVVSASGAAEQASAVATLG